MRARAIAALDIEWITEQQAAQGAGQHADYTRAAHQLADAMPVLALAHHLDGDPRFAAKIREGLLHFADYRLWCGPSFLERRPPWQSELTTATFCFAYALGYDTLRDRLPLPERQRLGQVLADRGVLPILRDWLFPETRIHALDSMGHNWWMVCVALAGVAALALRDEHPEAAAWIDRIEGALPVWFGYAGNVLQSKAANFDADGGYCEGVGYANYALLEYLRYRTALVDVLPERAPAIPPELRRIERFFVHTLYPTGAGFLAVNFGDHDVATAAASSMRLLLANGLASDTARWYVARATGPATADPWALLFDDADPKPSVPPAGLPCTAAFRGIGWALLRSSWEDDATLLAVRSGPFWGHAHADAGSFLLFHRGRPLIADSGKCAYHRQEYRQYYVTSAAHNVVLVDGEGVPPEYFNRGTKFSGTVHSLLEGVGLKYVYADATGPMAHRLARHYRHWLWVDGAIVIFDDLFAHALARFQWLLHPAGQALRSGRTLALCNGPAGARVEFLHPDELDFREVVAPAPDNPDAQSTYWEASTRVPARQQNFVTVVLPNSVPGEPQPPRVDGLEGDGYLGVRITTPATLTDVYFNLAADGRRMHENSNSRFDGWETDAYALALSRPAGTPTSDIARLTRVLAVGASYVRREGVVLLESLSKVDTLLARDGQRFGVNSPTPRPAFGFPPGV